MTDRSMRLPHNLWKLDILSHGISGLISIVEDKTVIKHSLGGEDNNRDHIIERRIYERLGQHPRIVRLISIEPGGIVLERLKYPVRKLLLDLRAKNELPSPDQVLKWSRQTAEGLQYIHSKAVLQGDISTGNLLLGSDDNIKFCDFAGSSIDGENSFVCPSFHAMYPFFTDRANAMPTVQSELFALGSILYEISTTFRPHDAKEPHEVEALHTAGKFEDTSSLLLGNIILKCWKCQYTDSEELITEIDLIKARRSNIGVTDENSRMRVFSGMSVLLFITTITLLAFYASRHSRSFTRAAN